MDTVWQSIKAGVGTLTLVIIGLIAGVMVEKFLNQPIGGAASAPTTYRVPKQVTVYVMPAGYMDLAVVTLDDGTVLFTNGVGLLERPPETTK